jgi:Caspase domain
VGGTRSALIVASSDYTDTGLRRLRAPASDAQALAAVLHDPGIGGFEVRTLLNEPAHEVNLAVEEFFADRQPDDLLLLHFSCHGVKDEGGELYFAMANTLLRRLGATAVAAEFVNRRMSRSRSRRVVLLLDCCYAGAFERGMTARAGEGMGVESQFGGRGRAVITASSSMEYAFEGDELADTRELAPSVFTSALVEGLETGEADRDQDGLVALDELYDYIYDKVRTATPNQTPGKWAFGIQGELVIARRARPVAMPAPLPRELQVAIDSPLAAVRAAAVQELARLLQGLHAGLALAARLALERLTEDDSRTVSTAAIAALNAQGQQQPERGSPEPAPPVLASSVTVVTEAPESAPRAEAVDREIPATPQAPAAAEESEAAALTLWTEGGTRTRCRVPSRDLIGQVVSELSLPGEGNSFLVIERQDQHESFAQAARTAENDYVIEYRDGDAAGHFAAPHLTMAEAQAALEGWAFNLPRWRDQFTWARVDLGDSAAAEAECTAGLRPTRSRGGTWATSTRTAQDDKASMITPPVKALGSPPTQPRQPHKRREQVAPGGGHGIPSVDSATPDGTQPPPTPGKPPGKQHRRFSGRARILAGSAGMLTLLVVVIVVIAVVNSGSTPPPPTSLLPATATIFEDNFSSQAYGWALLAVQGASARYANGAYRIYGAPNPTGGGVVSSPKNASSVYPSAPSNIRVEVDARFVPGSVQAGHGYSVACRASPNSWYAFTIWDTFVSIDKFFSYKPYYKQLKHASASAIHLNAYNLLQAQCTGGGQGVQLVFSVNGHVVVAATDTDKPLQTGSAGLGVELAKNATKPVEAEFDNFVVKQV